MGGKSEGSWEGEVRELREVGKDESSFGNEASMGS